MLMGVYFAKAIRTPSGKEMGRMSVRLMSVNIIWLGIMFNDNSVARAMHVSIGYSAYPRPATPSPTVERGT
ncbi:hypothetical protein BPOR_0103g00130 [Botrytis porri]|uniref:Uncharacterized protein n=1 Tax=Botrytis porri TaxID=87229 RepID=A0A4Z1KYB0_9HELO|nr:hypothetical protein BPOR_0103g00130 [Botrytis porri]